MQKYKKIKASGLFFIPVQLHLVCGIELNHLLEIHFHKSTS